MEAATVPATDLGQRRLCFGERPRDLLAPKTQQAIELLARLHAESELREHQRAL